MPREDEDYLADMRSYAYRALDFTEGLSLLDFSQSTLHQYAAFNAIATIGEAASRISGSIQQASPAIPWTDIIGMRNRLIHAYYAVNVDIVWNTIQDDLPTLIAQLEPLLSE
ncbi:MAG: DUF86 domain-containing protein [Chloroflexota bacterium]|nr:DUF86 domain-containing protein [Chloroflexota bacterium]MDE2884467.1 DUF86 domain-containing protein [Chloroflexota bacterium]